MENEMLEPGTMELLASFGVVGTLGLLLGFGVIKNFFTTKKEVAMDEAATSLYENLVSENKRMADMLVSMGTQLNILLKDNSVLLQRVSALEASVKELSVWEAKAITLQADMHIKDQAIADLKVQVAQQALLIEKMNRRVE